MASEGRVALPEAYRRFLPAFNHAGRVATNEVTEPSQQAYLDSFRKNFLVII